MTISLRRTHAPVPYGARMQRLARALLVAMFTMVCVVTPAVAVDRTVTMRDSRYAPRNVTIRPGDTVTWTNAGDLPHDASGGGWSTPLLQPSQTASVTFAKAGTYPYQCTIHAEMRGTVIVRAAGALPATDTAPRDGSAPAGLLLVALVGILGAGFAVRRSRQASVP
jgi:plastocyanin